MRDIVLWVCCTCKTMFRQPFRIETIYATVSNGVNPAVKSQQCMTPHFPSVRVPQDSNFDLSLSTKDTQTRIHICNPAMPISYASFMIISMYFLHGITPQRTTVRKFEISSIKFLPLFWCLSLWSSTNSWNPCCFIKIKNYLSMMDWSIPPVIRTHFGVRGMCTKDDLDIQLETTSAFPINQITEVSLTINSVQISTLEFDRFLFQCILYCFESPYSILAIISERLQTNE